MEDFTKLFDFLGVWFERLVAMFLQIQEWLDKTFGEADADGEEG